MTKKKRRSIKRINKSNNRTKKITIGIILCIALISLLPTFFMVAGFFSFFTFGILGIRSFVKKTPIKAKKYMTYAAVSFGIFLTSGIVTTSSDDDSSNHVETDSTVEIGKIAVSSTDTSEASSTATTSTTIMTSTKELTSPTTNTKEISVEKPKQAVKSVDTSELAYKEFEGTQTIVINDNNPGFSDDELSMKNGAWEKYGDLDNLNRATSAEAMLNQSLMPTEKRGDISRVTPTGWKNKKIKSGYLYNRSHLIGHALAGENDNWKNLITGTRQLNSPEMLRHEMDVKYYLDQSPDNYVRYSVTPVFREDELLARGVNMRAQSINTDAIKFNVYIFNIQDGVTLNYADGSSEISVSEQELAEQPNQTPQSEQQAETPTNQNVTVYVTPTGERYHTHAHGRGNFTPASLDDAKARGLTPCKVCY